MERDVRGQHGVKLQTNIFFFYTIYNIWRPTAIFDKSSATRTRFYFSARVSPAGQNRINSRPADSSRGFGWILALGKVPGSGRSSSRDRGVGWPGVGLWIRSVGLSHVVVDPAKYDQKELLKPLTDAYFFFSSLLINILLYYCVKAKKFRLSSHTSKSSGPKHSSQKCSMACSRCLVDPSNVCPSSGYV